MLESMQVPGASRVKDVIEGSCVLQREATSNIYIALGERGKYLPRRIAVFLSLHSALSQWLVCEAKVSISRSSLYAPPKSGTRQTNVGR